MELFDLRQWPKFQSAGGNKVSSCLIDEVAIDSRRITSQYCLFVALPGSTQDGHHFLTHAHQSGARYALVNKALITKISYPLTLQLLQVEDVLQALQEIATVYRLQLSAKIIAITGSVGKTMVKDLLYHLLKTKFSVRASPESFNSQIGVALSLFKIEKIDQYAIIEAGISKPAEMAKLVAMILPDHAILTKVDHKYCGYIDNFSSLVQEKMLLLQAVALQNWVLLPKKFLSDLFHLNGLAWDQIESTLFPCIHLHNLLSTRDPGNYEIIFPQGSSQIYNLNLPNHGDLECVQIAIAAAWLLGIEQENITRILEKYTSPQTISQYWRSLQGAIFINERFCEDLSSIQQGLNCLQRFHRNKKTIFLFGGLRQSDSLSQNQVQQIAAMLASAQLSIFILIGLETVEAFKQSKLKIPGLQMHHFQTLQIALEYIQPFLQKDDVVLIKTPYRLDFVEVTAIVDKIICDNILTINLAAIERNLQTILQRFSEPVAIMAMIKAIGYGTDASFLAQFLQTQPIELLGVAHLEEAIALYEANIYKPIFVLHATIDEMHLIVKYQFQVGISAIEQIYTLQTVASNANKFIKIHLHVDTGMGRLGCRPEQVLMLAQTIEKCSNVILEGIFTHLSSADLFQENAFTKTQITTFSNVVHVLHAHHYTPRWIHITNSYGSLCFPDTSCNMIRTGLGLFGCISNAKLHNALTLTSRIVAINLLQEGDNIGYGRSYCATRPHERIGIIPLGYFDGIHTQYSGKWNVVICNQLAPLIGKICMDFLMIDITNIPDAKIGTEVLIFGMNSKKQFLDPVVMAQQANTHVYQLITCLGPRIRRLFTYHESF